MSCDVSAILQSLQAKALETSDPEVLGGVVVQALKEQLPQASWVGIYWLRGDALELGPFVGPPTDHRRIPVGRGVCGGAVAKGEDVIVDDVAKAEDYLACSPAVRSEIVVLIRFLGEVIGQIDVDSEKLAAFDATDHCVLRSVADGLAGLLPHGEPRPPEGRRGRSHL